MDYFYEIALSLLPGVGPIKSKNLIQQCGCAQAVFAERASLLRKIPEIGDHTVRIIQQAKVFDRAEKELRFIEENQIRVLYFKNEDFPNRLLHCADHPILLYQRGNADLNPKYSISIVGTRNASEYGKQVTQELIESLRGYPVHIVSGLAYGIDKQAHSCSMDSNLPTLGVVAHGLDRIYPRENAHLAQRMTTGPGVVSEFVSGTIPDKENFPTRNRIVAGLSDVTVVVESKERGGSLITARLAAEYNREVYAVPGKISDANALGCNQLIKKHLAAIYTGPEALIKDLNWKASEDQKNHKPLWSNRLNSLEKEVVSLVQQQSNVCLDDLLVHLKLNRNELQKVLLEMELKGIAKVLSGGGISLLVS